MFRTEQRGGDHSYAVLAAVGLVTGADHRRIEQVVTDPVRQPAQVPHVTVIEPSWNDQPGGLEWRPV